MDGLEPTAFRVSGGCANQLRHIGICAWIFYVETVGIEPTTLCLQSKIAMPWHMRPQINSPFQPIKHD